MTEAGAVELWRSGDGLWRYRYVRPDGGRAIRSNRAFPSRQEALDSIRIAYPGVPASEIEEPAGRNRGGRGWGRRVGRTAIAAGVVLSTAAAIKAGLRARRAVAKAKRLARFAALVASAVHRRTPRAG